MKGRQPAMASHVAGALVSLLLLQLAVTSHGVRRILASEATAAVPPSITSPELRTGYHFQPSKNWMNGTLPMLIITFLCVFISEILPAVT